MNPRIQLDETVHEELTLVGAEGEPPSPVTRQLLDVDWEDSATDSLMLYISEEPRVGLEFSYHGLEWEIVEYRDGWVAKLLVG